MKIVVFAKAPEPGGVKTRLISALGAEGAAALHARLVRHTLRTTFAADGVEVELCCSPSAAHPFFIECRREFGVELTRQDGADLGARMLHAFERLLPSGPALLLGTDCPALQAEDLKQAQDLLLHGTDAVFGPAEDGGYFLVGLRRCDTSLFSEIEWGSNEVMDVTRARLVALRWQWREIATRWDVDRPEDLHRLRRERLLAGLGQNAALDTPCPSN